MNIFTYGSLMFPQVWQKLVKNQYDSARAYLKGYQRYCLQGESYPAVVPVSSDVQISGVVYFDIALDDLEILDEFEGELYQRHPVQIESDRNLQIAGEVYVLKQQYHQMLSQAFWDPEIFLQRDILDFIAMISEET